MARHARRITHTRAKKIAEAEGAIRRLEASLARGNNRFGSYGAAIRDAIERWQRLLHQLRA